MLIYYFFVRLTYRSLTFGYVNAFFHVATECIVLFEQESKTHSYWYLVKYTHSNTQPAVHY